MATFIIRVVDLPDELLAVFAFRYQIYVREMGRNPLCADHVRGIIEHPLDAHAINIAAFEGNEVIGAVRLNYGADGPFGALKDFYGLDAMNHDYPNNTSITSK